MAIRTITFEATLDGISPKAPQNAGIQGEHNATTVVIKLSTQLITELNKPNTYYRFEFVDCMGQFDTTENFTLSSGAIAVGIDIPNGWTSSGGNAELRLVIVRLNADNNEEMILYSLPCKLKFEGRDTGTGLTPETVEKGLSGLIADAKTATESANSAASSAINAASSADAAASAANAAADAARAAADAAVAVGKKTPEGGEIFNSYTGSDANRATAPFSHAEGSYTTASGYASHAEGSGTTASGYYSHAEGRETTASGDYSHAEGSGTTASGHASHAEGGYTTASGAYSHAEGGYTTASGAYSHAEGIGTKATVQAQTSIGKYNAIDADALFIVGNGTHSSRSNAFTVKLDGSATVQTQGTSNNSVIIKSTLDTAVAEAKSYTDTVAAGKADKSNTYTKTEVDAALSGKVDKVEGKGLSTNDYTNADKAKVNNLPANTNAELALKANAADVESALSDKADTSYVIANLEALNTSKADKSSLAETNLRVAEISKDLSDYKAVLSQLNPNQEAKQTISDYGIVPLPVNAANGHMDVAVGGVTRTNILTENQADVEIDTSGFLVSASATLTRDTTEKVFGNASLKVVTPGSTHREGFITDSRPISPLKTYTASVYLKGSGTLGCYLQFYSGTTYVTQTALGDIVLSSNWQRISLTGVAPENANNIRLTVRTKENTPQAITFWADGLMIEEGDKLHNWIIGTKSTVSAMRIVSESEDKSQRTELYIPDYGELRSVPNGTADEISGGQLIQRVKTIAITADDIRGLGTSGVNVDWVVISKPTDYIGYGTSAYATGTIIFGNYTEKRISTLDLPENINCISSYGPTVFYLVIPNDTYADLNAAKTALAGTKLTYQLAEPIITPINVSGTLLSYPKGTVYAEPVLPVAGIYTAEGIAVTNTDFPIDSIEQIVKIDFATGLETPVDVSQAVIAEDRLSFTHEDLSDGDIVFFTYYYSNTGTQPKISATYFDSRYVLKDTVTGKFYKKVETVQNGQLVTQLVEVS